MKTATAMATTQPVAKSDTASIALVALFGVMLVFLTGFAHATVLHDSSHDVRHSISFPCH